MDRCLGLTEPLHNCASTPDTCSGFNSLRSTSLHSIFLESSSRGPDSLQPYSLSCTMASDRSRSSHALSREQSSDTNEAQYKINGETTARIEESSRQDTNGEVASEDGDADLFGDGDDSDAHTKP